MEILHCEMHVLLNAFGMCLCVPVKLLFVCTSHHLHVYNVMACVCGVERGFFMQLLYKTSTYETPWMDFFFFFW